MKKETIIHEYFKAVFEEVTVLVQLDPKSNTGTEIMIHADGSVEITPQTFDEQIKEDLAHDGFQVGSALEFNLYLKGFKGSGTD